MLGSGAKKLESVVFNKSHFESFARDVLLVKHYCIEIYTGSKTDWSLQYQASPGNLTQVEDLIFGSTDITAQIGILAFKIGSENQVGCTYVPRSGQRLRGALPDARPPRLDGGCYPAGQASFD